MCPCNWPKLADSWARCALLAIAKRIRYFAPCHVTGSRVVIRVQWCSDAEHALVYSQKSFCSKLVFTPLIDLKSVS